MEAFLWYNSVITIMWYPCVIWQHGYHMISTWYITWHATHTQHTCVWLVMRALRTGAVTIPSSLVATALKLSSCPSSFSSCTTHRGHGEEGGGGAKQKLNTTLKCKLTQPKERKKSSCCFLPLTYHSVFHLWITANLRYLEIQGHNCSSIPVLSWQRFSWLVG